jgi:hypothetical protein
VFSKLYPSCAWAYLPILTGLIIGACGSNFQQLCTSKEIQKPKNQMLGVFCLQGLCPKHNHVGKPKRAEKISMVALSTTESPSCNSPVKIDIKMSPLERSLRESLGTANLSMTLEFCFWFYMGSTNSPNV